MITYDEAGSIGKRYRRRDEIGTPYCITIDFETLDNNTVDVRDRDTHVADPHGYGELAAFIEKSMEI
ncbi:MAG: His/Gly/Thr/Pro-type tRNA ligase C-terminal domain-containing protein [Candidatus Borkfalkia sp.]